jgi:dTDP-4-dehydrorhamnose reductase
MRLLVFGQTGQVARELIARANGHDITALGRDQADLSNPQACAQMVRNLAPDAVINAAAYTAVDKAEEEEDLARIINGETPGAMAEAAAEQGIPFVHVSTDYVFGGEGENAYVPHDPVAPQNAYGRTKLYGEEAVRAAGGTHVILRTSWVFSAYGNNFVKTMLRLGASRDELTIVSDQIGGPTAASDIADALLAIAPKLDQGQSGGTYHFTGAPYVSWADFARAIFAGAGLGTKVIDIPTTSYPTPAKRPLNSRLDCTAITDDFGIAVPDWHASLEAVLRELDV